MKVDEWGVFHFDCDCCGDIGHHHLTGSHYDRKRPTTIVCIGETTSCLLCGGTR